MMDWQSVTRGSRKGGLVRKIAIWAEGPVFTGGTSEGIEVEYDHRPYKDSNNTEFSAWLHLALLPLYTITFDTLGVVPSRNFRCRVL